MRWIIINIYTYDGFDLDSVSGEGSPREWMSDGVWVDRNVPTSCI